MIASASSGSGVVGPTDNPRRYKLDQPLGKPGMEGAVWKAADMSCRPPETVAIKLHHPGGKGRPSDDDRLLAVLTDISVKLRNIRHAAIVALADPFQDAATGQVCVPMPFVEGPTFARWAADEPSVRQRLTMLAAAADGVDALHAAGLVHGDIKPDNLIVDAERGQSVLVDYGLTRIAGGGGFTRTVAGTPGYQPPEMVLEKRIGPSSDRYMFAVTILFAIGRTHPPTASTSLTQWATGVLRNANIPPAATDLIAATGPSSKDRVETSVTDLLDLTLSAFVGISEPLSMPLVPHRRLETTTLTQPDVASANPPPAPSYSESIPAPSFEDDVAWQRVGRAIGDTFGEKDNSTIWTVWAEDQGGIQAVNSGGEIQHMEAVLESADTDAILEALRSAEWVAPDSGRSLVGLLWEFQHSEPEQLGDAFVWFFREALGVASPERLWLEIHQPDQQSRRIPQGLRDLEQACSLDPYVVPAAESGRKSRYRPPPSKSNPGMHVGQIHRLVRARSAHPGSFFGRHEPFLSNSMGKFDDELFVRWLDDCVPLTSTELQGRLVQKLGENRSTHLVELNADGSLMEWNPFRPDERWDGKWCSDAADVLRIEIGHYDLQLVGRRSGIHEGCENPGSEDRTYFLGAIVDPTPGTLKPGDQLVKLLDTGRSSSLVVREDSCSVSERWLFDHTGDREESWIGQMEQRPDDIRLSFGEYRSYLAYHPETGLWMGDEFGPDSDDPTKIMVFKAYHPSSRWSAESVSS